MLLKIGPYRYRTISQSDTIVHYVTLVIHSVRIEKIRFMAEKPSSNLIMDLYATNEGIMHGPVTYACLYLKQVMKLKVTQLEHTLVSRSIFSDRNWALSRRILWDCLSKELLVGFPRFITKKGFIMTPFF